jgi:hypothetical protein
MRWSRVLAGVAGVVVLGVTAPAVHARAAAVAPGCTAAQPTRLGGQIFGYPDNRALDAIIGVETKDAAGNTVDLAGAAHPQGYTYIQRVNPDLPATGSDTTARRPGAGSA